MVTTDVEKIDETRIKLSITVEADRVTKAIDAAAARLAGQVKIPGFRPGKAPLKVLESRLGKGAVAEEAVRQTVPGIYDEAIRELGEDVIPVGQPSFDIGDFERGKEATFTATVDVRPEFEVPDYEGLVVEHPEWELTDEELQQNLDAMRERFAEVDTVDRPAEAGDFVTVTITGKKKDGTVVDEASAEDMLYRIPTEESDSELDARLVGASAGDTLEFTDVLGNDYPDGLAGQELDFTAEVKEVKVQTLPELDDEFALTASEFDTIEELKADLREQIGREKRQMARANLRGKVVEAVADLVEVPLPAALVEEEQRFRLNRLAHQAEHNGLTLDQFLSIASGGDVEELLGQLKTEAEQTVKAQLVVDEIGQKAGIQVEQADLGQEIGRQAMRLNRDPNEIAELMLHPERIGALYADAYRRKAIDMLMAAVEITNVPPDEPEPELEAEAEGDEDEVTSPDSVSSQGSASSASSESSEDSEDSEDSADSPDEDDEEE